jgi:hypothetical protein
MSLFDRPDSHSILEAFSEEIQTIGGRVTDSVEHEGKLYVRSTLDREAEVAPGDRMRAGIALRASDEQLYLHPYVFRLVCRNGAIFAQATQTRIISLDGPIMDSLSALREAIHVCAQPEAFEKSLLDARGAMEREADLMLLYLPLLSRLPREHFTALFATITRRFAEAGDGSRFGLMNAVTSTARDTRDPEVRWRLEELGAQVPALLDRTPHARESKRAMHAPTELVPA